MPQTAALHHGVLRGVPCVFNLLYGLGGGALGGAGGGVAFGTPAAGGVAIGEAGAMGTGAAGPVLSPAGAGRFPISLPNNFMSNSPRPGIGSFPICPTAYP